MRTLSPLQISKFRTKIYRFYHAHPRVFPWRPPLLKLRTDGTLNPYRVLVSEVMLQQTQATRVIPYYRAFLKKFPTINSLAGSSRRDVITAWSGLGYNRRALFLKEAAEKVVYEKMGRFPDTPEKLETLPGVGPATAAAVAAFAYNYPSLYLDTNVRSVFLHEFFPKNRSVADTRILPLLDAVLDRKDPRTWYYALLDFGAALKKRVGNPSRRSALYVRQKPFRGSIRELRGKILKILTTQRRVSIKELRRDYFPYDTRLSQTLGKLVQEGFIIEENSRFFLRGRL